MKHYSTIERQFHFRWKEWCTVYLFFLFACGLPLTLKAETSEVASVFQNKTKSELKGVILSADNEPVIGANVRIEGTNEGVITDLDGQYSISVPSEGCKILISFMGFKSQTLTFNGKIRINFVVSLFSRMRICWMRWR